MSAQIPETKTLKDLLKPTGFDCPEELQDKTFAEATSGGGGSGITIEPITITQNGTATAPSGKAYSPITVNVPSSGGADLEADKKVSITANGIVEITPTDGKDGMKKVTANVNVGGSGISFIVSKSYNTDNSSDGSLMTFLSLQSMKADTIRDGTTITAMLNYDYRSGTYTDREFTLLTVGEIPLYKVSNSPTTSGMKDALFIGNPYLAGIEGWEDNGCPIFTVYYANNDGGYTFDYTPDYPNYGSAEVGSTGGYRGRIKIGDDVKICTTDLSSFADTLEDISSSNYLSVQRKLFIRN